jgi:hypothetical protein
VVSRLHHSIQATLELTFQDVERMESLLQTHLEHAEAIYAALVDESGTTLVDAQSQPMPNKVEICTLANSALGAVQEMARRLEDDSESVFFHQGRRMSFAVAQVTPTTSSLTVYGPQARLGLVRAALALSLPKLAQALELVVMQPPPTGLALDLGPFDPESFFAFTEMASDPLRL